MSKGLDDSELDIERLRAEFGKLILQHKAEQLGVREEDLVFTVRGGRRVFTSRQRLAKDLERQRGMAAADRGEAQRAIRNGEESIIADIHARLEDCFHLLKLLAESAKISPLEQRDTRVLLRTAADNALRLGAELQSIESEIERKKREDPLLSRLDELARTIHAARLSGDHETAARLLEENREDLSQYESRRRALGPDIESTLHCRYGLLREQRRVMRTQLRLYCDWAGAIRDRAQQQRAKMASAGAGDRRSAPMEGFLQKLEEARRLHSERPGAETTAEKDVRAQSQIMEGEMERLRAAIGDLAEQIQHMEEWLEKVSPGDTDRQRMAFIQRRK